MPAARNLVEDLEHLSPIPDVLAMIDNAKAGHYDTAPEQDLARDLEALQLGGADVHGRDFMVKQARLGAYKPSAPVEDADGFRRSPPDPDGNVPAARADDPPQQAAQAPNDRGEPQADETPADHADSSVLSDESEAAQP